MAKIKQIWAREILDSRGFPTLEAACFLDNGAGCAASVPGGTSTGTHEAVEKRDNDAARYHGLGVLSAVENVNSALGPALIGLDPVNQTQIDQKLIEMDGTENKSKYGANAILAVSEAVVKAGALANQISLFKWVNQLSLAAGINNQAKMPTPLFNMINGGRHGAGNLDFQEFLIIPATTKSFPEGLHACVEIYFTIGANLERRGAIHSVGVEGGFAPNLFTNADAFEVFVECVKETKYDMGQDVFLGLDVGANTFYRNGEYSIRDKSSPLSDNDLLQYYKAINQEFHFALLEDPFHEDAWGSWIKMTQELGNQMLIVGDDLLATNPKRIERAIQEKACNALLVKPNQIGTISETLQAIKTAQSASWSFIVSHRSGETNDSFIADFAVGTGAPYVKFGAPARGERVAKYNRLLSIDAELNSADHG